MTGSATILPRSAHRGRQKPSICHRPQFDSEDDAHAAVALTTSCGQKLDPWQTFGVSLVLAQYEGALAASEVGILVARQNGKGGILEAVAIWSLFEAMLTGRLTGRRNTTMWTAHELKTSDEAYGRVVALIKENDDLAAEVVEWNGGLTGQHVIRLRDGSRLVFVARSKSSGRGFSPRRIIFDEAQEFSALKHRALMYATSAQGVHRQLIYTGTVPSMENDSAIWTGVRDRGRKGSSERLAWGEWTPKGSDNPALAARIDPTDWTVRAWSNPALNIADDHGIMAETIDAEWEAAQSDIEGFLSERLSIWPTPLDDAGTGTIDVLDWRACPPLDPPGVSPVVLALEVSLDRTRGWLLSIATTSDGLPQADPVTAQRDGESFAFDGTGAIPRRVAQVVKDNTDVVGLAVDKYGQASSLVDDIRVAIEAIEGWASSGREFEIVELAGPEFIDASGLIEDAIRAHRIAHGDSLLLETAVKQADVKERDGVRYFSRSKSGPESGPFFALLVGFYAWRSAGKSAPPVQPFALWG